MNKSYDLETVITDSISWDPCTKSFCYILEKTNMIIF